MAEDRISLPSGTGGITRYFDEKTSRYEIPPQAAIAIVIFVIILLILLHIFAGNVV